jgi:hypothetical protein
MSASHRNGSESIHQRTVRLLKAANARVDEAQLLQLRVDSEYYNGKIKELEVQIERLHDEKSDSIARAEEFLARIGKLQECARDAMEEYPEVHVCFPSTLVPNALRTEEK